MQDISTTLFAWRLLQIVLAVPLLAIVGQGVVWVLARVVGQDPTTNFFYRLLAVVPMPFNKLARLITPRAIPDARMPFVALCLLAVAYGWTMIEIANVCHRAGLPVAECLARRG
jgi:hypothetical protein